MQIKKAEYIVFQNKVYDEIYLNFHLKTLSIVKYSNRYKLPITFFLEIRKFVKTT